MHDRVLVAELAATVAMMAPDSDAQTTQEERRRRRDHLARTEGTGPQRGQPGADNAGQGLQRRAAGNGPLEPWFNKRLAGGRSRVAALIARNSSSHEGEQR